jgi:tetratricopeptide (TPR) repeat protein
MGDTLQLQAEVAQAIARQIRVLTSAEATPNQRHVDPQAYEAYVEGSFFGSKVTEESLAKSAALLTHAVDLDPGYAQGWAALSHTYYVMGMLGLRRPEEAYPNAEAAAQKAIGLDPSVAEAHNTLAEFQRGYKWNWAAAAMEYERALELNPSYALAHSGYAGVLSNLGRHEEAIRHASRARELDPISVSTNTALGRILYRARRYDDAIRACRKARELDPNDASPLWWMALSHEERGELPLAIGELEKAVALSGDGTLSRAFLAHAYGRAGEKANAARFLDGLKETSLKKYVSPMDMAVAYTGIGDRDGAFEWLERAYRERTMRIQELPEALFDSLREDRRFGDLIRRLGLAM